MYSFSPPPGCHVTLSRVPRALLYCHFYDTGSLPEFSVTSPYSPSTRGGFSVSLAVAWHLCPFSLGPRSGQESGARVELRPTTQGAHPPPREEQPKLGVSSPWATTPVPTSHRGPPTPQSPWPLRIHRAGSKRQRNTPPPLVFPQQNTDG